MRDELEELTVAERVARRLAEQMRAETDQEGIQPRGARQGAGRAVLLVPQRERGTDEAALPKDYQQVMDAVRRANGPAMVKQVCRVLGLSTEPARSEARRSKLNRLAERGWPTGSSPRCERTSTPGMFSTGEPGMTTQRLPVRRQMITIPVPSTSRAATTMPALIR
ncbi:hypothetical protein [Streptomyces sp. NPDC048425]|uniref:hypothetical protein n=1 Tax=Streptomyces sp. NPDC048425 TaxID=3365548 RepID=UPI003710E0A9